METHPPPTHLCQQQWVTPGPRGDADLAVPHKGTSLQSLKTPQGAPQPGPRVDPTGRDGCPPVFLCPMPRTVPGVHGTRRHPLRRALGRCWPRAGPQPLQQPQLPRAAAPVAPAVVPGISRGSAPAAVALQHPRPARTPDPPQMPQARVGVKISPWIPPAHPQSRFWGPAPRVWASSCLCPTLNIPLPLDAPCPRCPCDTGVPPGGHSGGAAGSG